MTAAQAGLPGDPNQGETVRRMIRVDHAGEYAAARIYAGQLAVLGRSGSADTLRQMQAQEQEHLDGFAELVVRRRVRPTALLPLWHLAGFALGALTAAMGERAAMACTVAVEETIDAHYAGQIAALDDSEAELRTTIVRFREDELHHRDVAVAHGARQAPAYRLLTAAIKAGCRAAIAVSERV
jgi:ubiquinone biosynthesis monooxygenase Coq7